MNSKTKFLRQFIKKPQLTGAILPSSKSLAKEMIRLANPKPDAVIAEYGPGCGAFTIPIVKSLLPTQKFFTVEVNPEFAQLLQKKMPNLKIHLGCASKIKEFCKIENIDKIDCIISGLPWAIFPDQLQKSILDGMLSVLDKDGKFITFSYVHSQLLPPAKKFKNRLKKYFSKIELSPIVWKNIPPAFVYKCVR